MTNKHISWWGIALALVIVGGIIFLMTGYDAGLPLHESKDERRNLDEIYVLRGLLDDDLWKPGYPPGLLYINYGAQLLVEQSTGQSAYEAPCEVVYTVRVVGILTNLLTLVMTAFLGRKLGGDMAGIVASVAWLIAPRVLAQNQFGFPQVYEGLFFVLTAYLAVLAVEKEQPRWAVASTLAGLGAVLFKYTLFPVLGAGVGAALWLLLRNDRKRWAGVLGVQLVLIVLTAVALMTLGGAGSLAKAGHAETTFFLHGGLNELLNIEKVMRYVGDSGTQIGLSLGVLLLILAAGTLAYWSTATTWQRLGWVAVVGLGISHSLFMVTYVTAPNLDRNLLTASSLLAVAVSVAVLALGRWLGRWTQRPILMLASVGLFLAVWLTPQLMLGWQWIHFRDLPVTYGAMVQWLNQYLPEETILVSDERPFTRDWSCDAAHITTPRIEGDITERPLTGWLAQDILYAQLTQERVKELQATPEGQAYLDQMTLLASFPPPGEEAQWRTWRRGNTAAIAVYRLWSADPQVKTETVFGEQIRLLGYDLETANAESGDTLTLRFYWQPLQTPAADYNVFVHLVAEDDAANLLAQGDGTPARSALRPTSTWNDPGELFISREFVIPLPDTPSDAPEKYPYRLLVGLYDWRTGQRLLTETGEETVAIPLMGNTSR